MRKFLIRLLVGKKPIIANCKVFDKNLFDNDIYYQINNKIDNFGNEVEKLAEEMVKERDRILYEKQRIFRYGNSFVLKD